jgi:hypothetical protein
MAKAQKEKLEKDIQREVCEKLTDFGCLFWRSPNVPIFAQSNDGKMRFRRPSKFTPKGLPDVTVILKGKFIGLEIKTKKGLMRPDQEIFRDKLLKNGGRYYIIRDVSDLNLLPEFQEYYEETPGFIKVASIS